MIVVMNNTQALLSLLKQQPTLRPCHLARHGIPRSTLYALHRQGRVEQRGRGLFALPNQEVSEHHTLVEAIQRVPHGVVCLLSALRFHALGTQNPHEIWLAIDVKARKPTLNYPPLHIVRFSGAALREGIELHAIEGVELPVTSIAKTVADCFKYRNKIGLDVALEALRVCRRERRCTIAELWQMATVCRVQNVIRPYLEAIG